MTLLLKEVKIRLKIMANQDDSIIGIGLFFNKIEKIAYIGLVHIHRLSLESIQLIVARKGFLYSRCSMQHNHRVRW
jgi:hypothetical protein